MERNYGIDLGKMCAMLGVCVLHVLNLRGDISTIDLSSPVFYSSWALEILCFCAVDVFAMITGYLMCTRRAKIRSLLYIYLQVAFISLVALLVASIFYPDLIAPNNLLAVLFPPLLGGDSYWYITAYFIMYLFIPVMNVTIKALSQKQHLGLLVAIFFGVCVAPYFVSMNYIEFAKGGSATLLIVMYFFGAYIYKYQPKRKFGASRWLVYGFLTTAATYALVMMSDYRAVVIYDVYNCSFKYAVYTAPFVVISAYCFVRFFSIVRVAKPIQKFLDSFNVANFGVYVIHCNYIVFNFALSAFCSGFLVGLGYLEVVAAFLCALCVFFMCLFLDKLRYQLFEVLRIRQFCTFVDNKLTNFVISKFEC